MVQQLDHIVILVRDLDQAIADYHELGFTVVPGGEHPGGDTHNALVAFEDGSYLELIAFRQAAPQHRWWSLAQHGEGLIDYALLPTAIEFDIAEARRRGLQLDGPFQGGRARPDGVTLAWQIAQAPSHDLPFLCGDVTPRELRVPAGDARQHANGVTGVAELGVAVNDVAASARRYHALRGTAPAGRTAATYETPHACATFMFGETTIALQAPLGTSDPYDCALQQQLATRGEGPFEVIFRAPTGTRPLTFDRSLAHGARLRRVPSERWSRPVFQSDAGLWAGS